MLVGRYRLVARYALYYERWCRVVMGGRRATHVDAQTTGPLGRYGGVSPVVVVAVAGATSCGTINHTTSRRPAAVVLIKLTHRQTKRRRLVASDARHDSTSNGDAQRNPQSHAGADTHAHTDAESDPNPNPNANPNPNPNPNPNADTDPNSNTGAPDVQPRLRHRDGERRVDQHHWERLGAVHQRAGAELRAGDAVVCDQPS